METPPAVTPSKTWLIVFGVLKILIGFVAALFAAVMLAQAFLPMPSAPGVPKITLRDAVPAVACYLLIAAAFVALGWGTICAKRWARRFSLILDWGWLIGGVVALVFMVFLFPSIMRNTAGENLQPGMLLFVMAFTFAVMGVLYILLPGVFLFFYHHAKTRKVFETLDPAPGWSDRYPASVLALGLVQVLGAAAYAIVMPFYHFVFPFFGSLLTGGQGAAMCFLTAFVMAVSAWGLFRFQLWAWFAGLAAWVFIGFASIFTYGTIEIVELYKAMGYSADQLEIIGKVSAFTGMSMVWFTLAFIGLLLIHWLYVWRYFRPGASAVSSPDK